MDLKEKFVSFSVEVIRVTDALPNRHSNRVLGGQLIRSSSSIALNFAESRAAESRKDFVHKLMICLKEARESQVNLEIIMRTNQYHEKLSELGVQAKEIVAILTKSVLTAKKNMESKK